MGKDLICEGCGEKMAVYMNGRCHPEAAVNIYMLGAVRPGIMVAECSECDKPFAEFTVSEIVDLEKHPKINRKLNRCSQ